jgi:hypothetical protein
MFTPAELIRRGQVLVTGSGVEQTAAYARLSDGDRRRADHFSAIEPLAIYPLIAVFSGILDVHAVWGVEAVVLALLLNAKPDVEAELDRIKI